jgi:hypothetical protein
MTAPGTTGVTGSTAGLTVGVTGVTPGMEIAGLTAGTTGAVPVPEVIGLTVGGAAGVEPTGMTGLTVGGAEGVATEPIGTTGLTTGITGVGAGVRAAVSPGLGRLSIEIDCVRRGGATGGAFGTDEAAASPGLGGPICAVPVFVGAGG